MNKHRAFRAIVITVVIVGVLDLLSAFVIWWQRDVGLVQGLQSIAAGLLGSKAYKGGIGTVLLGLMIHFFIVFVVVSTLYLASRKIRFLTEQPVVSGMLYGMGVYLVMYWIVLPAAFPTFKHRLSNDLIELAIHICLIGLPAAFLLRHYCEVRDQSS